MRATTIPAPKSSATEATIVTRVSFPGAKPQPPARHSHAPVVTNAPRPWAGIDFPGVKASSPSHTRARYHRPVMADTPTPGPPSLRASDEDRERVATVLRDSYSHGRLDLEELQQRLDAAYAAKTVNELTHLTADLPATPAASAAVPPQPPGEAQPSSSLLSRRVRDRVLTYVLLMVFLIVIWAISGGGSFWPIWPIVVGAFILALDLLGIERRRGPAGSVSRRDTRRQQRDNRRRDRGR